LTELRNYAGSNVYGVGVNASAAVISVSINHKTGNILTLVGSSLTLFDINGKVLVIQNMGDDFGESNRATCAVATDCPEWMESGVVAVTGHANGDIRLWSLDTDNDALVMQHLVPEQIHSSPITVLRCAGDRQDTLLVGDASGKLSVWKTLQLENLTQQELGVILQQITSDP
jgi:WD40 repeat protein